MQVLIRLTDLGNTVIIIVHHLDVIKQADWIVDLGPEGGEAGGEIVAVGTPEDVAAVEASSTGDFLRRGLPKAGAAAAGGVDSQESTTARASPGAARGTTASYTRV